MENNQSLPEILANLKEKGYDQNFEPGSDCLYCNHLDLRLNEEDFKMDEVHRLESPSDPTAEVVVYAFTSPTGVKGTVVDEEFNIGDGGEFIDDGIRMKEQPFLGKE